MQSSEYTLFARSHSDAIVMYDDDRPDFADFDPDRHHLHRDSSPKNEIDALACDLYHSATIAQPPLQQQQHLQQQQPNWQYQQMANIAAMIPNDIFRFDTETKAAIHHAAREDNFELIKKLLTSLSPTDRTAIVDCLDVENNTPLLIGCALGNTEIVQLLLEYGANVDAQNQFDNSPLHEAAWRGYSRTVEVLCRYNAKMHLKNRQGHSALHLCAQKGHNQCCRVLLLAGCKPNIKNNFGDTPLHSASRYGHVGLARILISAFANVNELNKNDDTSLHIAAAMGRQKLAKILLESGCNPTIVNKQGETPMNIALRKSYFAIQELIANPPPLKPIHLKQQELYERPLQQGSSFKDIYCAAIPLRRSPCHRRGGRRKFGDSPHYDFDFELDDRHYQDEDEKKDCETEENGINGQDDDVNDDDDYDDYDNHDHGRRIVLNREVENRTKNPLHTTVPYHHRDHHHHHRRYESNIRAPPPPRNWRRCRSDFSSAHQQFDASNLIRFDQNHQQQQQQQQHNYGRRQERNANKTQIDSRSNCGSETTTEMKSNKRTITATVSSKKNPVSKYCNSMLRKLVSTGSADSNDNNNQDLNYHHHRRRPEWNDERLLPNEDDENDKVEYQIENEIIDNDNENQGAMIESDYQNRQNKSRTSSEDRRHNRKSKIGSNRSSGATTIKPKLDTLPAEPLAAGEQYFVDRSGRIHKGRTPPGPDMEPLIGHQQQQQQRSNDGPGIRERSSHKHRS